LLQITQLFCDRSRVDRITIFEISSKTKKKKLLTMESMVQWH